MFEITYRAEVLNVELTTYADGSSALQVYDTDGLPYSRPTVNIPQYDLPQNMVAIRSDAVERGWLAALTAAGVVVDTGRTVPIGFTVAHLCEIVRQS